jgi:hypothetical protein
LDGEKLGVSLLLSSEEAFVGGTIVKPGYYSDGAERHEIEIWKKCFKILPYKRYPVDVTLIIGQHEYEAMLRFSKSHQTAWMPLAQG